ncbi:hypothetical protein PVL29_024830 [Vitis rotundifolia]|uniref:Uncharacterized protein n=1 Tax=Vitis rotundifolia TaxID=103349 RepID=A0AA39D9J8_VITRO|nr:hypothetical protein PVL29_024830 [Vitis rotundifolia]
MKKLSQPVEEFFYQCEPVDKCSKLVEEFSQSVDGFLTSGYRLRNLFNRLRNVLNRLTFF